MDREFEQTQLTTTILKALEYALRYSTYAHLDKTLVQEIKDIVYKIELNKLDVRLTPREE